MRSTIRAVLSLFLFVSFNVMAQQWTVGGNTLSANGRIGTNNSRGVIFETNNVDRGRVTSGGLWGFGVTAPAAKVDIGSASGQDALKVQVGGDIAVRR